MSFLHSYVLFGLAIPSAIVGLLFFLAFALSSFFFKKKYAASMSIAPLLCWTIAFLLSLAYLSPGFRYPLCAIVQQESAKYVTTGYVENVTTAPGLPLYYDSASNSLSAGKFVTVNNQQYYMPFGDVKVGSAIIFVWGCDEKVVYECSLETIVSETDIGTRPVLDSVETQPNVKKAGRLIASIFFVTFVIAVILLYVAKDVVSNYLIKKDEKVAQRIIPSKLGLLECTIFSVFFLGIGVGLVLTGFPEALLICAAVVCLRIAMAIKTMHKALHINEDTIVVKEGKTVRTFSKEDVTGLRYKPTRLPYDRCIEIIFCNGWKVCFDQLHFWGLSSVYCILQDKTGDEDNKTGDGKTGDGSL